MTFGGDQVLVDGQRKRLAHPQILERVLALHVGLGSSSRAHVEAEIDRAQLGVLRSASGPAPWRCAPCPAAARCRSCPPRRTAAPATRVEALSRSRRTRPCRRCPAACPTSPGSSRRRCLRSGSREHQPERPGAHRVVHGVIVLLGRSAPARSASCASHQAFDMIRKLVSSCGRIGSGLLGLEVDRQVVDLARFLHHRHRRAHRRGRRLDARATRTARRRR